MKDIKVYNVIFPIWALLFFPPVIFLSMIGNFIIDSLVVVACFYVFKLLKTKMNLKMFYKKSIYWVWIFGFVADFIGALFLFILLMCSDFLGFSYELVSAICYDPFSHPLAVLIIGASMLVSTLFIFLFNYRYTYKTIIKDEKVRFIVALTIALVTIPWTFLLPTNWFF